MSKKKVAAGVDEGAEPMAVTLEGIPGVGTVTTTANVSPEVVVEVQAPHVHVNFEPVDPYHEAIQAVLADPEYQHVGAHGTEFHAVERLVAQGHDREKAEREVRTRLY